MDRTVEIDAITRFAASVRANLVGLPPEQVDDLTDGLEADLLEALADRMDAMPARPGEPTSLLDVALAFGPATAYAAELRAAAGLAAAPAQVTTRGWSVRLVGAARTAVDRTRARLRSALRAQPWWPSVSGFLASLTPAVWLVRGWLLYQVLYLAYGRLSTHVLSRDIRLLPATASGWLVLAVVSVISVQWGRNAWQGILGGRQLRAVATGVAVLAVVPVFGMAVATDQRRVVQPTVTTVVYQQAPTQNGVWVDGQQVSNLFMYDSTGQPLTGVQVFDDRGRPVRTTFDNGVSDWALPGVSSPWAFVPASDTDGRSHWNVFPLKGAPSEAFEWQGGARALLTGQTVVTPPLPFLRAPAIGEAAGRAPGSLTAAGPTATPTS